MRSLVFGVAVALLAPALHADELSLRLGGKEIELTPEARRELAVLARDALRRCGPNTSQHPGNFGLAAFGVEGRWKELLQGSRLRVRFAEPFLSESHLGGTLGVSEALIGLEHKEFFVGPDFTRHGAAIAEHLQCGYLPLLELACLAGLQPHLPARYRETCAKLERDAQGRIVMPPPDIAPSCS
ncbi:MAG TPA: hypothetical protein VGX52_16430 [Burkholderiales bacterium]|nr:hypothetical protein [Burkholderiales bacterium]